MRSRLDDLLSTAERQLAAHAYDASIDTYRTAMGEPGAVEAGVEALLEAACRARDEARGIARPSAQPQVTEAIEPAIPEPVPEPAYETAPVSLPVDERPIEPPAFHLMEDDPPALERPDRGQFPVEEERISILDPRPLPEKFDPTVIVQLAVAAVVAAAIVVAAYLMK